MPFFEWGVEVMLILYTHKMFSHIHTDGTWTLSFITIRSIENFPVSQF